MMLIAKTPHIRILILRAISSNFNGIATILVAPDALIEGKPVIAEEIACEYGVGQRISTLCHIPPRDGVLVDVKAFQAYDGNWYLSVWVMLDGREHYQCPMLTTPSGRKAAYCGNLDSLRLLAIDSRGRRLKSI